MIPLVNDNSPNAINTSLIAVKRELQTLLDAIKKINPTQEIIEQGGREITELTQAEYDALTPAQQDDGTVRVITDSEPQEIELAGHLIDDNAVANNKTWSSEKLQDKVKRFPDIARGVIHTFSSLSDWTCTEDCYFYTFTIGGSYSDSYKVWVNGVDVSVTDDSTQGSSKFYITYASGFAKKGDVLRSGVARTKVYGLKE